MDAKEWRSLYEVFSSIQRRLESLADMEFPSRQHDGGELDPTRLASSGKPLSSLRCSCADQGETGAEFAHTLGSPRRTRDIILVRYVSAQGLPSGVAEKCERRVMLDVSLHQEILAALDGTRGWSLTRPISPLDLLAGDRLEPCEYLRDVASFENMELPGYVVFWRPSAETVSKHNLLFSPSLGVGLGDDRD